MENAREVQYEALKRRDVSMLKLIESRGLVKKAGHSLTNLEETVASLDIETLESVLQWIPADLDRKYVFWNAVHKANRDIVQYLLPTCQSEHIWIAILQHVQRHRLNDGLAEMLAEYAGFSLTSCPEFIFAYFSWRHSDNDASESINFLAKYQPNVNVRLTVADLLNGHDAKSRQKHKQSLIEMLMRDCNKSTLKKFHELHLDNLDLLDILVINQHSKYVVKKIFDMVTADLIHIISIR